MFGGLGCLGSSGILVWGLGGFGVYGGSLGFRGLGCLGFGEFGVWGVF